MSAIEHNATPSAGLRQERRSVYRDPAWVFDTSDPDDHDAIVTLAVVISGGDITVQDESQSPYPYSTTLARLSVPGARMLASALLAAVEYQDKP